VLSKITPQQAESNGVKDITGLDSNDDINKQIQTDLNNKPLFDIFPFFRRRKKEVMKF